DLRLALAMANKFDQSSVAATTLTDVLPPDVVITEPGDGDGLVRVTGESVTVRALARGNGRHPVTAMRLIVNGRPYGGQAGVKRVAGGQAQTEASWDVRLGPGVFTVTVQA